MEVPRVVIAGTNSGCGKTTVSIGLMAALAQKRLKVQPYKVGPDYIDPMFHTFVTGRYSRNLDSWMLEEDTIRQLFLKSAAGSDLAVIEGVMGFYDGFGGDSIVGSTAHVSKILKSPVVLVMNTEGISLSAAAIVRGFMEFGDHAGIRGIILNRVNNQDLYLFLKEIIEENTSAKVLGYLPESVDYMLPERHLGLVPGGEITGLKDKFEKLAAVISETVNLELLMKVAGEAGNLEEPKPVDILLKSPARKVRIAVALDHAFNFYYRDNLELLETLGAELIYFSPLADAGLPAGIDGVYFGGGYPEVFARELAENSAMREDVGNKLLKGLPAYAECGGRMYLGLTLKNLQGAVYDMAGVFPVHSEMTPSLQRFGYVNLHFIDDCILGEPDCTIRAHEFHCSVEKTHQGDEKFDTNYCYEVWKQKPNGERVQWWDGLKRGKTLAGYPHLHFWSNPRFAATFVANCFKGRREGDGDAR